MNALLVGCGRHGREHLESLLSMPEIESSCTVCNPAETQRCDDGDGRVELTEQTAKARGERDSAVIELVPDRGVVSPSSQDVPSQRFLPVQSHFRLPVEPEERPLIACPTC